MGTEGRLKSLLLRQFGLITKQPVLNELALFHRERGKSFNILEVAFFKAAFESAAFYEKNMATTRSFDSDLALLSHAVTIALKKGLILEFGVATGRTISHIASHSQELVYGFDSFEGLPEAWRTGFEKGAFAGHMPPVPSNVRLIKGNFADTLPSFLAEHPEGVSFVHVDCDLYSSTKCIFDMLEDRVLPGCVIVFDEYFNYPGWQEHEFKAFMEFAEKTGAKYRYEGFVPSHQQVCVVIE